jgi:hypothetical protein
MPYLEVFEPQLHLEFSDKEKDEPKEAIRSVKADWQRSSVAGKPFPRLGLFCPVPCRLWNGPP